MKAKDIKPGTECFVRVGPSVVRCRVIGPTVSWGKPAWRVCRVDTGRELPKPRKSGALRPLVELPPTRADLERKRKAAVRAEIRKLKALSRPSDFAAQFHAAVSCREVAREARAFRARAALLLGGAPDSSFRPWLRLVLQRHLSNRAIWLEMTEGVGARYSFRAACRFERAGRGCSVQAARLAPMLGADPEVVEGMGLVRHG